MVLYGFGRKQVRFCLCFGINVTRSVHCNSDIVLFNAIISMQTVEMKLIEYESMNKIISTAGIVL